MGEPTLLRTTLHAPARGRRRWPSLVVALSLLWVPVAALAAPADPAQAEEPSPTVVAAPAEGPKTSASADGRRTMGRLLPNLGRAVVGTVSGDNLGPFLAGGVVTAGASYLDQAVKDSISDGTSGSTASKAGGPIWSTLFVVGMFTGGRLSHHTRFRAMTYDMLDASIVNGVYTEVLKLAVKRERPNGEDNKSFPSGHASNAFTLATVVQRHYGWKIGAPAYALAGLVGVSRLQQNKHYLSDVVMGGALGYIVGRTVVRINGLPLEPRHQTTWNLSPIAGRDARGMLLTVSF